MAGVDPQSPHKGLKPVGNSSLLEDKHFLPEEEAPRLHLQRSFPNSLDPSFGNATRKHERIIRERLGTFHEMLERAIKIGDQLGLFSQQDQTLIRSISVLSDSQDDFFDHLPNQIIEQISQIKCKGISNLISTAAGDNILTSLACLHVTENSGQVEMAPLSENDYKSLHEEFLIKSQLIFNAMIDSKISEYNYYQKINRADKNYGQLLDELEESRANVLSISDLQVRTRVLASIMAELLKTRVSVAIASKFGLISDLHGLAIESIWDPDARVRETEALGNRLKVVDQMLSRLFPEDTDFDRRLSYENELWKLKDYRRIYTKLYEDITLHELKLGLPNIKWDQNTTNKSATA